MIPEPRRTLRTLKGHVATYEPLPILCEKISESNCMEEKILSQHYTLLFFTCSTLHAVYFCSCDY
jgi:hypothetical protein